MQITTDLKLAALYDIWAFADLIDFRGGRNSFYDLHYRMAEMNCKNQTETISERRWRRRLFLIPREHRKSTVNTVLYSLWRIYRNPDIRIIVASNVKELALSFIRECRQYLEDEDLAEYVWNARPHIKGPLIPRMSRGSKSYKAQFNTESDDSKVIWNSWSIQVLRKLKDKQPTLEALSVGMRQTGKHCDLVIFDDIVDWTNSDSPEKAAKIDHWAQDIESVVTKKSIRTEVADGFYDNVGNEILINGTRYFEWDYYSKFVGNSEKEQKERLAATGYSAIVLDIYINGVDNSDGYICPEIFDEEVEQDLLQFQSIEPRVFWAQYRNKIMSSEDAIFSPSKVNLVFPAHYESKGYNTGMYFEHGKNVNNPEAYPFRLYMMIDLAVSKAKRSDKSVVAVGGIDEKYRLHLCAMRAGRFTPIEFFDVVYTMAEKWGMMGVYYEGGVGYQDAFESTFRDWMKTRNKRPIVINRIVQPRSITKEDRIKYGLQALFDNSRLYVNSSVWENTPLKKEITFFNPASTSNEDNCLDVLEMIARTAKPLISRKLLSQPNYGRHTHINTLYGGVR